MAQEQAAEVEALMRAYYRALERAEPLAPLYAAANDDGPLGPVIKIGSGEGEVFVGFEAVTAEVDRVAATFTRNRLESRGLIARQVGGVGWFVDQVWWSGEYAGQPFASLTRWTGVCLRTSKGEWKLLQLHVSEGQPEIRP